jgi:lysozyme
MNKKPIFDAVRTMLGRGFTQEEVDELDDAIDLTTGSLTATLPPPPAAAIAAAPAAATGGHMLADAGTKLIQSFEGCAKPLSNGKFRAYPDPGSADGKPWTIGWGSTGHDVIEGVEWSQDDCDERFSHDMLSYVRQVAHAIGDAPTTQNQFDALVSFHYNTGAIGSATLTTLHKQGHYDRAKAEFGKWVFNNHKAMTGLVRRRAAEAKLYGTD